SEEHTSELQSPCNLVCRLLLEKNKDDDHPPYLIARIDDATRADPRDRWSRACRYFCAAYRNGVHPHAAIAAPRAPRCRFSILPVGDDLQLQPPDPGRRDGDLILPGGVHRAVFVGYPP